MAAIVGASDAVAGERVAHNTAADDVVPLWLVGGASTQQNSRCPSELLQCGRGTIHHVGGGTLSEAGSRAV